MLRTSSLLRLTFNLLLTDMRRHSNNRGNGAQRQFARVPRRVKSFDPTLLVRDTVAVAIPDVPYQAVNTFESFALSDNLKRNIAQKGYSIPTPIQDQAIPHILATKDVIGIANTGTGKTAAFLIPLVNEVEKNRRKKALIIVPTRELAVQIAQELMGFARGMNIYSTLAIGGVSADRQKNELRRNPNFVIATPGRLKDLIVQKSINLSTFEIVVLDEVDQMVDIGFIADIKYFIGLLSKERQSLFFSATVDSKVRGILAGFVRSPVTISVKKEDLLQNIKHDVIKVADKNRKIEQLHDLLIGKEFEKVLIFGRTKWGVQKLSDELVRRGFNASAIHGNKSQSQRLNILEKFKRDDIRILLATDVASRGLDIDNVSHVINYDPPESYETYIHRIGRTGRVDRIGTAITFV